jgi:two-component system OmpR family sensor kinase
MLKVLIRLYLVVLITFSLANYVVPELVVSLSKDRYVAWNLDQFRGQLALIQQRFLERPKTEWDQLERELKTSFAPLEVSLREMANARLSPDEREQLEQGLMVIRLGEYGLPDTVLAPLDNEHFIEESSPPLPLDINLLFWAMNVLTGAALLACLLLWLRPHWRDLESLRRTASALGRGNLSARTHLSSRSNIAELGHVFDSMATDIERLLNQQQELLNAVSHELRTPLSRLDFGLALALSEDIPEASRTRLLDMTRHVRELDELVLELLSYSRLHSVAAQLERVELNLGEFIDSIVGGFAEELEQRGILLEVDMAMEKQRVSLEPRLTARALQNLIRNAIRYCNHRIRLSVSVLDQDRYQITVEDDGIGIPEAEHEKIFEPFYRLDRSRDRTTGGFGLGLAISRRAIETQNGILAADTSPLGGARFRLDMPFHM